MSVSSYKEQIPVSRRDFRAEPCTGRNCHRADLSMKTKQASLFLEGCGDAAPKLRHPKAWRAHDMCLRPPDMAPTAESSADWCEKPGFPSHEATTKAQFCEAALGILKFKFLSLIVLLAELTGAAVSVDSVKEGNGISDSKHQGFQVSEQCREDGRSFPIAGSPCALQFRALVCLQRSLPEAPSNSDFVER